ncbi:MAG TPA: hypothetical protein VHK27_01790 [Gammaproteobacteria bacterium]|nr:hypothetical protein [Gammaproteobacteria bacterium]
MMEKDDVFFLANAMTSIAQMVMFNVAIIGLGITLAVAVDMIWPAAVGFTVVLVLSMISRSEKI